MFGIGLPELIVLLLIPLFIVIPICLTRYFQKRFPDKRWVGITLSIIFCPWGHLYLKGASWYIITLVILAGISKTVLDGYFLPFLLSPFLMWYRFNKLTKSTEVPTQHNST